MPEAKIHWNFVESIWCCKNDDRYWISVIHEGHVGDVAFVASKSEMEEIANQMLTLSLAGFGRMSARINHWTYLRESK